MAHLGGSVGKGLHCDVNAVAEKRGGELSVEGEGPAETSVEIKAEIIS